LVALYESWLFPLVRMLTVPPGMIGALLLLGITGNSINIFSIIGLIMGEGLVAKSGILLVDYTNTLRERGIGRTEALQEAVRVRLRPDPDDVGDDDLRYAAAGLKLEPGAETRSPMAVVVIGALLSSTVLTLVIVPSLYTIIDDLQTRLFGTRRKSWEVAAPASALPQPQPAAVPATSNGVHTNGSHTPQSAPGVPLNVVDFGSVYLVRAALPGVKQDDIDVSVHAHTLTIRGERHSDEPENGNVVVQEYAAANWECSMVLPQEVESAGISARYEDGILELRLPKAAPRRSVPINGPSGPPDR
jgi:HSP20 family molecular chaperone IbpA